MRTEQLWIGRLLAGILLVGACSSAGNTHLVNDGSSDASRPDVPLDHLVPDTAADLPERADSESPPDAPFDAEASPADGVLDGDAATGPYTDGPDVAEDGADAPTTTACRPACIERVFGPCDVPKTGTCSNTGSTICYSNGVRLATTLVDGGADQPYVRITAFQPDGTMCGWYTATVEADGGSLSIYYDPQGQEIGRQIPLMPDAAFGAIMYTCDGETFTVTSERLQSPECQHLQARDCPMGACP